MTVWYWAQLKPLDNPIFLTTEFVFVLLAAAVAYKSGSSRSWGLQMGILYGYLYGVAVWGTITYHFNFSGSTKLILAGSVIVDAIILVLVFQYVIRRIEAYLDAKAAAAFHARRRAQGAV